MCPLSHLKVFDDGTPSSPKFLKVRSSESLGSQCQCHVTGAGCLGWRQQQTRWMRARCGRRPPPCPSQEVAQ